MVGDVFRRFVGRTLAKQFTEQGQAATLPFQYAFPPMQARNVLHTLCKLSSFDPSATILSIDGVGAYDSISRRAMFWPHGHGGRGEVGAFREYDSPSTSIWEDEVGDVRHVCQGEGGEQGDTLMPLLFSLGQHQEMVAVQASLLEGERLFAFLDDMYIVCAPSRVGEVYLLLQRHLLEQTGIQVHEGKTMKPPVADVSKARARVDHPEAVVWRGDPTLDVSKQGLNVIGVPNGHPQYTAGQ